MILAQSAPGGVPMSSRDHLHLLAAQDELERLYDLVADFVGEPQLEAMNTVLLEALQSLTDTERIATEAGLLDEALPWWQEWQRRRGVTEGARHSNPAASGLPQRPSFGPARRLLLFQAGRNIRDGQARITRQQALVARMLAQDHRLAVEAEALLHASMRAQELVKVHFVQLLNLC